jgi:N-acyl-D-amino-acid deacylase
MDFDIGIVNGKVIDGTGNPWFKADIGIKGKTIKKVGRVDRKDCGRVIDAKGRFVCPGFIDIHTHSDLTALVFPGCDSTLRQGVTTHLIGNCGLSVAPLREPFVDTMLNYWGEWAGRIEAATWRTFAQYLRALERSGVGHNIAALVGHGAIRTAVLGPERRAPRPGELRDMKALTKEAMEAGAFGMSTGLVYPPSCFADTDEVVELCKVVARYDGLYASHIRGERETIASAIKEAILIGERTGVRVQVSHNCPKIGAWGRTEETLGLVREARERGLDVTIDNDVHTDLAPTLASALPQYVHELTKEEMLGHLESRENRRRLAAEIREDKLPAFGPSGLLKHGKFDRIIILHSDEDPDLEGKSLAEVAEERGKDPFDTYFDLIVESRDEMVAIFDYIQTEDIKALLRDQNMMISSDCATWSEKGLPGKAPIYMPCAFGEHPGIFERYVRDEPVLTMQEAVRKMTSFPAQKIGLTDRGVLRPGMRADISMVDLEKVKDLATNSWPHSHPFVNYPHRYPEGIPYVVVNGTVAVDRGRQTKDLAGEVIRAKGGRAR